MGSVSKVKQYRIKDGDDRRMESIQASHAVNASDDTGDGKLKPRQLKSHVVSSELMT